MRPMDKEYQEKMVEEQKQKINSCFGNFLGIMSGQIDREKAKECRFPRIQDSFRFQYT